MKLCLLLVGETDDNDLKDAIDRYVKRLSHYCSFDVEVIKTPKQFKRLDMEALKVAEGKLILDNLSNQDFLVLLDEKGKQFSSVVFSGQLQKWLNGGHKRIVFLVGGAFGFSEDVYQRADFKMALSSMTFTHQMVRLVFTEQLYRAFTILKNEKYHH
ncbi:MAG: 23S rRNA (pseudouridine(1915)-N(3))-methyltransferase RlmH [Flavobacteriales bacterium]|nr:23S rRNA (pseudouridine(1915)-N(3))-methyltransferase RlmH [Flavobacteriales bacterium]